MRGSGFQTSKQTEKAFPEICIASEEYNRIHTSTTESQPMKKHPHNVNIGHVVNLWVGVAYQG